MTRLNSTMLIANGQKPTPSSPGFAQAELNAPFVKNHYADNEAACRGPPVTKQPQNKLLVRFDACGLLHSWMVPFAAG